MIRFIKHHFDTINGVEIYPIVSLLLFFTVFVVMVLIVLKLPKDVIEEESKLPLDND